MTKEEQRTQLHRTIWSIADDLRGSTDGWDFKQYILGFLVYRFLSEKFTADMNSKVDDENFDYSKLSDEAVSDEIRDQFINEYGYFIYPSELFCNVREKALNDKEYGENLNVLLGNGKDSIFDKIESRATGTIFEEDFKDMFSDINTSSTKFSADVTESNKKLKSLLEKIGSLDLSYADNIIDAFGDAYEYLMTMYASNAGKSGGEFFTPQEVSMLLCRLATYHRTEPIKNIYDPACGSGSLLLKAKKIYDTPIYYAGQEINPTTYNLCRMNMLLHGVNPKDFSIQRGDTLINPMFDQQANAQRDPDFDCIVSNPPYSLKWEGADNPILINDPRYTPASVLAPKSKADFAFIMNSLYYLNSQGAAAIVCFPGMFYRSGAELKIRKFLVDNNYIDTIIAMPENLFFGTSIATYIMVMRKNKKDNSILFVDATKECEKVTNSNRLNDDNIDNIVDIYGNREDREYISKLVHCEDIAKENYNLSVSTYVEKEDSREQIDICQLNEEIKQIVSRVSQLRESIDSIIEEIEA